MWKKIAYLSMGTWFLSLSIFAYFFYFGTGKVVDKRMEITLAPEERELILSEMNQDFVKTIENLPFEQML